MQKTNKKLSKKSKRITRKGGAGTAPGNAAGAASGNAAARAAGGRGARARAAARAVAAARAAVMPRAAAAAAAARAAAAAAARAAVAAARAAVMPRAAAAAAPVNTLGASDKPPAASGSIFSSLSNFFSEKNPPIFNSIQAIHTKEIVPFVNLDGTNSVQTIHVNKTGNSTFLPALASAENFLYRLNKSLLASFPDKKKTETSEQLTKKIFENDVTEEFSKEEILPSVVSVKKGGSKRKKRNTKKKK